VTKTVLTITESFVFPDFSSLYQSMDFKEERVSSVRQASSIIKKKSIDLIVAEFLYAYSTNYSGIYKSNLEVLLVSLIKYSPKTQVVVIANKDDFKYIHVLNAVEHPVLGALKMPTSLMAMRELLEKV